MSGYFDALMRASGPMAAGVERPAFAADEAPESAMPLPLQIPPPRVEQPARAQVSVRTEKRDEMAAALPRAESKPNAELSQDDALPPHVALPDPMPVTNRPVVVAESPEQDIARQVPAQPQAEAPQAIELVRAALRWVASDPSVIADAARPTRAPDAALPVRTEPTPALKPLDPQREILPAARPANTTSSPPAKPIAVVDEVRARPRGAVEGLQASEPRRRVGRPAPASEPDAVEVSIGAIHIKVDPPASLDTVTPPPPAPRHTVPRPITPRSSLARRSLRRL